MSNERLLLDDNIIKILIGDSIINNEFINGVTMPNLSGPKLCKLAEKLGMNIPYNEGNYKGAFFKDI